MIGRWARVALGVAVVLMVAALLSGFAWNGLYLLGSLAAITSILLVLWGERGVREEVAEIRRYIGIDEPGIGSVLDAFARLPAEIDAIRAEFQSVETGVEGGEGADHGGEGSRGEGESGQDATASIGEPSDVGQQVVGDLAHGSPSVHVPQRSHRP
ncbi:MAG: hypothetical protein IE935_13260 [Micrococcales bacterium]|nr:hypothetical protein [Micrococcales bacterium]